MVSVVRRNLVKSLGQYSQFQGKIPKNRSRLFSKGLNTPFFLHVESLEINENPTPEAYANLLQWNWYIYASMAKGGGGYNITHDSSEKSYLPVFGSDAKRITFLGTLRDKYCTSWHRPGFTGVSSWFLERNSSRQVVDSCCKRDPNFSSTWTVSKQKK